MTHRPVKGGLTAAEPLESSPARLGRSIRNSSKNRDIVLDLFGGSGTTLIAAERTGRSARLVELDPKYSDVIVERWQNLTGGVAVLDGEDRTYEDLKTSRGLKTKGDA